MQIKFDAKQSSIPTTKPSKTISGASPKHYGLFLDDGNKFIEFSSNYQGEPIEQSNDRKFLLFDKNVNNLMDDFHMVTLKYHKRKIVYDISRDFRVADKKVYKIEKWEIVCCPDHQSTYIKLDIEPFPNNPEMVYLSFKTPLPDGAYALIKGSLRDYSSGLQKTYTINPSRIYYKFFINKKKLLIGDHCINTVYGSAKGGWDSWLRMSENPWRSVRCSSNKVSPNLKEDEQKAFKESTEEKNALLEQIQKRRKFLAHHPTYHYQTDSFRGTISTVWQDQTAPIIGQNLREAYEKFYYAGLDYQGLSMYALSTAQEFVVEGNFNEAKDFIRKADLYSELSNKCEQAAYEVYMGNTDASVLIAQGIYNASKISAKIGIKSVDPSGGKIFDAIYLATDTAIAHSEGGTKEALKTAEAQIVTMAIFKYSKLEAFGDKTLEQIFASGEIARGSIPIRVDEVFKELSNDPNVLIRAIETAAPELAKASGEVWTKILTEEVSKTMLTAIEQCISDTDRNSERIDAKLEGETKTSRKNNTQLIARIQTHLSKLGYYKGKIDGLYGPQTSYAIKSYQIDNKLPIDSRPSDRLLSHIETQNNKINQTKNDTELIQNTKASKNTSDSEKVKIELKKKFIGYLKRCLSNFRKATVY